VISSTVVKTLIYVSCTNVCNTPTVCPEIIPGMYRDPKEGAMYSFSILLPMGCVFLSAAEGEKLPLLNNLPLIWTHLLRTKYLFPQWQLPLSVFSRINVYVDHCDHTSSSVPRLRMRGDKPPLHYTFLLSGAYVSIGTTLLQTLVFLYGTTNEVVAREPKARAEIFLACVLHCSKVFFFFFLGGGGCK